jgi:aquaporin TIP
MNDERVKVMVAEAIGTFTLIFIGVLAISAAKIAGAPEGIVNLASIAFAHGLAIAVMVAALGAVSGGHFNPAITLGFVVTGRMPIARALLYWIAQLVGATLAGLLLVQVIGADFVAAGTPDLGLGMLSGAAITLEAVGTFFLVFVVFGTAVDERAPKSVYPMAIGLTITMDIMAIGPLTGGAVNPARAFGPALASGHWAHHVVYWIGPLVGGALGGLVYHHLLMQRAPSPAVAERGGPAPSEERN